LFTASACCAPFFAKSPNIITSVSVPKDFSAAFCTSSGTAGAVAAAGVVAGAAPLLGLVADDAADDAEFVGAPLPHPSNSDAAADITSTKNIFFMNPNSIPVPHLGPAFVAAVFRPPSLAGKNLPRRHNFFDPRLKILFALRPQPQLGHRQRVLNLPYPREQALDVFPGLFLVHL
jgi:hypothetical protein